MANSKEQVHFDFDTAPEYVKVALRTAARMTHAAGLSGPIAGHLDILIAAAHHLEVQKWLTVHGYLKGPEAIALSRGMVEFYLAMAMSDL